MKNGMSVNDLGRSLRVGQESARERVPFNPRQGRQVIERRAPRQSGNPPASRVCDIMTRNVRFCRPEDSLAAAAIGMFEADCRFLPVVDEAGRPIGVVTDGDICLLGSTSHRRLSDMSVRDAMSGPPATCRTGDDVLAALEVMREHRIRHLPVIGAQGLLEGVLSLTDVVLCAQEKGSASLRQELAAALREIVQKHGNRRVIVHNPFMED